MALRATQKGMKIRRGETGLLRSLRSLAMTRWIFERASPFSSLPGLRLTPAVRARSSSECVGVADRTRARGKQQP